MTQPGRKNSFARSAIFGIGSAPRLKPPDELDSLERAVFVDIVASCEPTHFRASDMPLLTAYCRAVVMERRAAGEYAREPVQPDGAVSPWAAVHASAVKSMLGLSLRLRLSPQGRSKVSTKAEPNLSYYQRLNLEESDTDEDQAVEIN
jgi:phage terminase small subunit